MVDVSEWTVPYMLLHTWGAGASELPVVILGLRDALKGEPGQLVSTSLVMFLSWLCHQFSPETHHVLVDNVTYVSLVL